MIVTPWWQLALLESGPHTCPSIGLRPLSFAAVKVANHPVPAESSLRKYLTYSDQLMETIALIHVPGVG